MGTEGAGSADTAVRDAIGCGPAFRAAAAHQRQCISVLGGHEDAIGTTRAAGSTNADYANNADRNSSPSLRRQLKEGADFIKIYETGRDSVRDGKFHTPYQYTEAELELACARLARQREKGCRARHR